MGESGTAACLHFNAAATASLLPPDWLCCCFVAEVLDIRMSTCATSISYLYSAAANASEVLRLNSSTSLDRDEEPKRRTN